MIQVFLITGAFWLLFIKYGLWSFMGSFSFVVVWDAWTRAHSYPGVMSDFWSFNPIVLNFWEWFWSIYFFCEVFQEYLKKYNTDFVYIFDQNIFFSKFLNGVKQKIFPEIWFVLPLWSDPGSTQIFMSSLWIYWSFHFLFQVMTHGLDPWTSVNLHPAVMCWVF